MKSLHPSEGHSQERARDLKKEPAAQSLYSLQPADEPANRLLIRLADAIDAADDVAIEYDQTHDNDCGCHFCDAIGRKSFHNPDDIIDDVRFAHETLARLKGTFDNIVVRDKPAEPPNAAAVPGSFRELLTQEFESAGSRDFRNAFAKLREAQTACKQFVDRHGENCRCAFCLRESHFNYSADELLYEVEHVAHSIGRFLDGAKHEGGIDPRFVDEPAAPVVIAARVQADLPEELRS